LEGVVARVTRKPAEELGEEIVQITSWLWWIYFRTRRDWQGEKSSGQVKPLDARSIFFSVTVVA